MRSSEYWQKRFEQLEESQHRKGQECYEEIEKQYRAAQRELEGQINSWYGRFAKNNEMTMVEARRALDAREMKELKWDVQEYIKYGRENAIEGQWMKELENASAAYHISRLEALKLHTQQCLEKMFGNQLDSVDSAMRDIYKNGYYRTAFEIQKGVGVGWDFSSLDERTINKVIRNPWTVDQKNFSQRIWGNCRKVNQEVSQTLTRNIILGQDPQKAIDQISRRMDVSKHNAGRLVMTEEAYFSSEATRDAFKELDVEEYEIVATLDSHTSETCREMDGKHFKMSEWEVGETAPPFHVWCRTTTAPYFDDEAGERAARGKDGKTYYVPSDMTYKEWEKSFLKGDKTNVEPVQKTEPKKTKENIKSIDAKLNGKNSNGKINIESTTNFAELEEYIYNVCGALLSDGVKTLDFETARDSFIGFNNTAKEFNDIWKNLKIIETSGDGVMSYQKGGLLTFNSAYYNNGNDLSNVCNLASQSGDWVKNCSVESLGAHEAAHCIEEILINLNPAYAFDFERTMAWNNCTEAGEIVSDAIKIVKQTPYGNGKSKETLIKAISKYATDNDSETLAESFHDVYVNGEDANPLSIEIKRQTIKKLQMYKGGGTK